MGDHQPPPNWVAERARCNLDLTWESLIQVVQRDVVEANKIPTSVRGDYIFDIERNDEGTSPTLRVGRREADGHEYNGSVTFTKFPSSIIVSSPYFGLTHGTDVARITATPEWSEQTLSCRLHVNGEQHKVWELSQIVLGPLFFQSLAT